MHNIMWIKITRMNVFLKAEVVLCVLNEIHYSSVGITNLFA